MKFLIKVMLLSCSFIMFQGNLKSNELIEAINKNNISKVEELANSKLNINSIDNSGITPLMVAARNTNKEAVDILLKAGANVNAKSEFGDTALIWGINISSPNLIRLYEKFRENNPNEDSKVITEKVKKYHKDIIETLINAGDDVNIQNKLGYTPLTLAVESDRIDLVKLLLRHGANINQDIDGLTPLDLAKQKKLGSIIELLEKYKTS